MLPGENCELELAQDAVLEFDPAYFEVTIATNRDTITRNVDSPKNVNEVLDDPETFRCIILKMSSSLIGNHATIRVPYDFKGSVIYASTRSNDVVTGIEPFDSWDPQWKPARYLRDINIVKPIEQNKEYLDDPEANKTKKVDDSLLGRHASLNGEYNGTAVFIEGYRRSNNTGSTFIWGLDYSGLRIAGAFKFGVYGTNNWQPALDDNGKEYENWAWTNDMKIDGIIDGCEIGVYLYHCNNAYISTIIQPRAAVNEDAAKYAIYGILLEESKYVDLTGSRVWDWDKKHTLGGPEIDTTNPKASKNYQHIGLKGDCKGLLLDDYLYHRLDEYDIRDLIYTDTPENFDTMSILQEPVSKYFKKSDEGKPFFHNGETSKELVLKDYFDEHFQTEKLYYYEDNILPNSKPEQNESLNEFGYLEGKIIDSDGNIENNQNFIITGYIDCTPGTTLYLKGLAVDNSAHYGNKIIYYYENSTKIQALNTNHIANATYFIDYERDDNNISKMTIPNTDTNKDLEGVCSMRICCHIDDVNEPIVSTKPITCTPKGYITDNIYVKEKFVEKQSTINIDSTNDQIPSAKAVYDILESALGEYITDVADLVGGDA